MLIVITISPLNGRRVERLLDWIYFLSGKKKEGHCLLINAPQTHPEYLINAKLTAELAFETVDVVDSGNAFSDIAAAVSKNYKTPWLLLDTDCVPVQKGWINALQSIYDSQPKKYLGAHVKIEDKNSLARNSIYPPDAIKDFNENLDMVSASTKCRLIQHGIFTGPADVRSDSILYCFDKSGELIKFLRNK